MNTAAEYLAFLVKGIVQHPENVSVVEKQDDMGTLLTVQVDKADMGRVIGKEGNTAYSLRTLCHSYGSNRESRVSIKISEPAL